MGKKNANPANFIDMTGWRMNEHGVLNSRITVLKYIGTSPRNESIWLCQCDCGKEFTTTGPSLRKGNTKSCGCLKQEKFRNMAIARRGKKRQTNSYELIDDYIKFYDTNENFCLIDIEDLERVLQYYWCQTSSGYWETSFTTPEEATRRIKLHKFLTNTNSKIMVDHKNRKKYDNRKNNLRVCNKYENARNSSVAINNTSGFTGVSYNQSRKRWKAAIRYKDTKEIFLGWYINKEDAIKARLKAEAKYYKEFAPQRHLFEQYGIEVDNEEQAN